jgi:DNA recombination protein RmuC
MQTTILVVLTALVAVLVVLVVVLLIRSQRPRENVATAIDASLKGQFLAFQTELNKQIGSTREEVTRSKDMVSEHALKTLETIKNMGQTIAKIVQQQEDAQKLGQSLRDLLTAPKLRGNYGEAILEEMLERVLPKGIWERQYTIDGREKVDAVIKYRDVIVPIDAKFPRDDYLRYLEAETADDKKANWRRYEDAVKGQIRSISSKYVKPEQGTSEFALMFVPSEAIYYETIADKNYLGEDSKLYVFAQQNRVIPVSPNTFYAFLQVIIHGVRNVEIIKSARKLQEQLSSVQRSFDGFYAKYEDIGKNLDKAAEAYRIGNDHIQRFKTRVAGALRLEGLQDKAQLDQQE